MDERLRNLQRLSGIDATSKDRYIRELERLVGLAEPSAESKLKCLVTSCSNAADHGDGVYLLVKPNIPGQAPYTWDDATGPLFLCSPCYQYLKNSPKSARNPIQFFPGMIGVTGLHYSPSDEGVSLTD